MVPPTNDGHEIDDGEPVAELEGISVPVDRQFGERVRGRIERRLLAGDLIELAWMAPFIVLIEWITTPFRMLSDRKDR